MCIAGIDGNGQTEFVYGLSGLEPLKSGNDHNEWGGYHRDVNQKETDIRHESYS